MYEEERSRVRHAESLQELGEITDGIQIRNLPLFGPFENGINPLPELKLLKAINNRLRRLINQRKKHRK